MVSKYRTIFSKLIARYNRRAPTQTVDPFAAEIQRIEKMAADLWKQLPDNRRLANPLEPITEHQKIFDLAG